MCQIVGICTGIGINWRTGEGRSESIKGIRVRGAVKSATKSAFKCALCALPTLPRTLNRTLRRHAYSDTLNRHAYSIR